MQADASLSFLDGFVAEGLSQGAAPYKPHHQRQEEQLSQEKGIFPSLYHESVCFVLVCVVTEQGVLTV